VIKQQTDIELIDSFKKTKDTQYIGELFTRYTQFVFAVSQKYLKNTEESKDAVMQIFEKLFDLLPTHHIENFKPWLYSVTKNHCLQQLRSQKHTKEIITEPEHFSNFTMENDDSVHLQEKIDFENKLELFEAQLSGLSAEQKICVELFYVKRMCYNDIANTTGYSLKQVKSYIQNGKRNLQLQLKS